MKNGLTLKRRLNHRGEICNLVLGYYDHYFESVDTIAELIPFEKYYERIVFLNSNAYFKWINESDDIEGTIEAKEIHILDTHYRPQMAMLSST